MIAHAHQVVHVVHFDQARQVQFSRQDLQVDQLARLQALGNQQHRVGARRPRLVNLVRIDDEVLAQDRQLHRVAHRLDVLQLSLEILSSVSTLSASAPAAA